MREVFGGARTVVLTVRNLARSRKWWVERLGFSALSERAGREVVVNLGNFRLRLEQADDARPFRGAGAAVVFRVRNLERTAKELDERGVAYEERQGPRDGAWLETGDPDGWRVVFVERI
jgi:catechol 2,3-dioxygenase-like lactoylglutathione lyase family enzyme